MTKGLPCEVHKVGRKSLKEIVLPLVVDFDHARALLDEGTDEKYNDKIDSIVDDYYAKLQKEGVKEAMEECHTGLEDGIYEVFNLNDGVQFIRKIG